MNPFRRNPRRLPGTLCAEAPAADAERHACCATCAAPITWKTSAMWGNRWEHDGDPGDEAHDHDAVPVAGADLMVPLKDRGRWFRPLTPEQIQPYASFASAIGNGITVPRIPVHEVPEPRDDSEYDVPRTPPPAVVEAAARVLVRAGQAPADGPVTAYLRHLLDEMTAARDQLDAANGVLVAKVRDLREQLAASR